MSKVNSIFINSNIAGGTQSALDNANLGIPNSDIIPNTTLPISQSLSATSSSSASSIPGSDSGETRANGVGITVASHFAATHGFSEANNAGSDCANQIHYSSLDRHAEDCTSSAINDGFELPASPEPNGDSSNKKRNRLRPEQTRRLMEVFERTPKPDSEMRKILGKQLEMTPRTVQIWFQNRRAKLKRESNTVNLMRNSVYAASGIFDGRNAHRLTYNRAYINRRTTGRVASDGYAHLRNIPEFDPYPHDAVHGLPLQNPSQISIPLNLRIQTQFPTLNSAPSSAHPSSDSLMFGNSAMGVPVGQDHRREMLTSAAIGNNNPNTNPFTHTGVSNDAMQSVLPNSTSFSSTTQAYPGVISGLSPALNMRAFGTGAQQNSMQLHDDYYSSRPAGPNHSRTRSFTADSHTLASLGQIPSARESNNSLAPPNANMESSPSGNHQHGLLNPHNTASFFGSSDGVPTAEALLESRRRHLNDLIIINQTQAVRGIRTSDGSSSAHISIPSSAVESDSSNKPLLFSNLSGVDAPTIDTMSVSTVGSMASGQSVAEFIANIGNTSSSSNVNLGMSVTNMGECGNPLLARTGLDDAGKAVITSMPAPSQSLVGSTTNSDVSALFEMGNDGFNDDRSSMAKESHTKAFGAPDMSSGLEHNLGSGDSNYQFINNLLLDCNALEFLGGQNSAGQEHPDISGASDGSPHLAVVSSALASSTRKSNGLGIPHTSNDAPLSQQFFADTLLVNSNLAVGSGSREGSNAPDITFSRELSANCPQHSSRSSSLSDSSISMSNAAADTESFLLASTSNTISPSYPAQSMADAVAFLHTSAPEPSSLQPKQSPSNQVSVARSGVPGQRDLMIEQLSYSTMQL
ncbi:hypothetical protein IW140_000387 [Coemansia sp. RSA 1813]|nr:hypothetical protein LPJ74_000770 [Coemansia sp. RSA 1843]KAJ2092727.1 hypothetical protein IW138_000821 [Coemansia sp. RSA 986]KAJ2572989.1 hypothetical protein IW140_000387 [Coemansia sp. RSA 1813]